MTVDTDQPLVLIVDDRDVNRLFLSLVLRDHYRLLEAADGEVALRLAQAETRPDLILLDLTMPKIDGREVLRRLRDDPETREIPVIVLTGDSSEESEMACLELGADDFLIRPFRNQSLLLRTRNLVQRRRLQQALAASKARAQLTFEVAPDPMLVVDAQARVLQANERAEAVFGYGRGELAGLPVETLIPGGIPGDLGSDQTGGQDDPGKNIALTGARKTGAPFPMLISLSAFGESDERQTIVGINDLTERHAYESRLRESGERYRQLFENMAQGVATVDALGTILDINPAACEILGRKRDALQGARAFEPDWQCICEDGAPFPAERQPFRVALLSGQPVLNELMGVARADEQRTRWILVNATPLFQPQSDTARQVHVTFTDVTSRREAQEAYRKEQQLNDAIVESSGAVLVVLDRAGRMVRVNAAVEQLTGFKRSELLGQPVWDWLTPVERIDRVKALFADPRALAESREYEDEWVTRNGERIPFHCYNRALLDESGTVSHIVTQGHDLRMLKAAQEALRISEERQRLATEGVNDGVWDWNLEDDSVYYSPAWMAMVGYGPDELAHTLDTWKALVHPDDKDRVLRHSEAYLTGESEQIEVEFRMRHKDGHWVHVLSLATLARDSANVPLSPRRLIGKHSDVTQRKQFERELQASNARFKALFESSPDPILIGVGERIEDCNQATLGIFGLGDKAALRNVGLALLSAPDQPDRTPSVEQAERMMALARNQGTHRFEWLCRRADGGNFLAEATLTVAEVDGHPMFFSHLRDITTAKANEATILLDREQQTLLRLLLEDGFADISLTDALRRCLQRLMAVSWLSILPKGGIFLAEAGGETLRLVAEHGLSSEIRTLCAKVMLGQCLCGRAAASQQMQFACCVDERHETGYSGMEDHGHYSLPLLAGETLVGVLVLYLPLGFQRDARKEEFLHAVAKLLAGIIQQKLDEQALRDRELLYRNVVETSIDGFFLTDAQGRILEVNASYERISGYHRDALLEMYVTDLESDASRDDFASHVIGIVRDGADLFETWHRASNGTVWPVELSVSYLPSDGGQFFVFARDIGPREEMRQKLLRSQHTLEEQVLARTAELEDSRQKLASIIDNLPAILFIKDTEGRYQTINQRFERDLGLSKDKVIGQTDAALFPPDIARRVMRMDRQMVGLGRALTVEESIPSANGLYRDYLSTKIPLFDAGGTPQSMLGIAVDITQMKSLQAQLSRAQTLARVGSWRLDIASDVLECSDETYRIFGLQRGLAVNHEHLFAVVLPADRQIKRQAWEKALSGEPYDVEYRIQVGQATLWVREQAQIRFSERGLPIMAEGSVQDITEIQATQEALKQAASEAQRAARLKSEFLANMSHEIRTPLNGILGLAQIGQRQSSGRNSERLFDQILDSGQLLLGIVNDILDFSKIEAGKLRIETVDVQFERLIQHVSIMCGNRASAKGVLFRIESDDQVPAWFKGDPLRIAQILVNLVGNAIKFTEHGEVVLSVRREGERLLFGVRDTGIGMAEAHLEQIFTPFEQADGSTTRRFGGTGLGLAITHRLVSLMEGDIRVESTLGCGSLFEVRLPLLASEGATMDAGQLKLFGAPAQRRDLAGLRVLAAEDNIVNRMVLEDILEMEGVALTCVENGLEALKIVETGGSDDWDIVLTDIHMPVMNGHELARRLREIAPGLPIIGVTAHAMAEEQLRCLDSGMVAHVAKPIVIDELIQAILKHARHPVQKTGPGAAGETPQEPGAPAGQARPDTQTASGAPAAGGDARPPQDADFDLEALVATHKGRRDFVCKLLVMVASSHQETPGKLRTAALNRDFEALAFVAHSFAGVAGTVSAHDLNQFAKAIEKQARSANPEAFAQAGALAMQAEQFLATVLRHAETLKPPATAP